MYRLYFLMAFAIALSINISGQTPAPQPDKGLPPGAQATMSSSTEKDVMAREQAYLDALRKRDAAAIGQFFSDDYTYTGVNGQFMTKTERLDSFKSTPPPTSLDFTDLKAHIHGDTAVVTGRVKSATGPNGQAIDQRAIWVWANQGGTWRIVAGQSTSIVPAQPEKKP
jgi:ketosteroid isomerase-like protein